MSESAVSIGWKANGSSWSLVYTSPQSNTTCMYFMNIYHLKQAVLREWRLLICLSRRQPLHHTFPTDQPKLVCISTTYIIWNKQVWRNDDHFGQFGLLHAINTLPVFDPIEALWWDSINNPPFPVAVGQFWIGFWSVIGKMVPQVPSSTSATL